MRPAIKEIIPNDFLWRTYREKHDLKSQENLVKQYMYLVDKMANRLSVSIPSRMIPKEDLIGLGYIGLIEAIKKFDYQKGYQFETYGLWRIKGAMLDGIRQMDWVPRGLREKAKKLNTAYRQLEQNLLRSPSEEELSQYLNMSQDEVDQAIVTLSLSTLLSLNEPINAHADEGKEQSRLEQISDNNSISQEQQLQMGEFRNLIAEGIDKMPEKERLVISLLYYEGLTQVEIAEVLNLTKGRISQIHSQAILRLRRTFEAKGFSLDSFI
ncbi:sigma-70 family RNA polymerase sigma factor [Neobacillus vireti]|uniref:RNA polymerase sigma-D factor (Sigma-28) n=1 Tax=Neobacillus vireti LMG 21834 TaxID=1131730 RepID=A0AB94IQI1_9BACI|nr:FliA/WhiG family RNA polymerase sigma factor [Neobacillus vireti]ETI69331.1 RNA polymerase sigma-D factor (Sigma-28) [Neobacillus vireti LMG 21834]KLT19839.1 RNA polymerase sigma factor SigD [Neobacillus vireti]